MSTLQQLETYYSHVTRVRPGLIAGVDLTTLTQLAQQVDAGTTPFTTAALKVEGLAAGSVSVAELTYQFFTGATPLLGGLDFLAQRDGPNPNNLNSAYFQDFNVSNRYINLAVSVGSAGEGKAAFTAAYGAGSLIDATTKAYSAIFGFAPAAGKVDAILNAAAPDGRGGTYTRADYFAELGQSARDGLGAKAAMVGFLLGEAVKADLGPYAHALDAFLADLGLDGIASGHVDLLSVYGAHSTAPAGASLTVDHDQSVAPDAASASLRSTSDGDTITAPDGLDAAQSIKASGGGDTITVTGVAGGLIDAGSGDDRVTVDTLPASVALVGGATNGTILLGDGNDTVVINALLARGSVLDGGAGDDTAIFARRETGIPIDPPGTFTGFEHIVVTEAQQTVTYQSGTVNQSLDVDVPAEVQDVTTRASHDVTLSGLLAATIVRLQGPNTGGVVTLEYQTNTSVVGGAYGGGAVIITTGQPSSNIHLDGVISRASNPTSIVANNLMGDLNVSVDSDSALSLISGASKLVVTGVGKLTAGVGQYIYTIDASAAAAVDLTQGPANTATVVLSSGDDRFTASLYYANSSIVTLGAGADTLAVLQDPVRAPLGFLAFVNMTVTDGSVTGYLTVTDFAKGIDHVALGPAAPTFTNGLTAFVGGATTLDQAIASVSPHLAAGGTGVFQYGGDSWIYHQDSTVGANTGDGLIRLVGVTGLSVATGAATGDIHYG